MKIGVINFSGNVGKTTVSRHLLSPRMNNSVILSIESINSNGNTGIDIRGKEFGTVQNELQVEDNIVVDIGASNVEDFLNAMSQYTGAHEDFDYFVVPVVKAIKQQRDTISTIETLSSLGIPAHKIRVVFNQIEFGESVETAFSALFSYQEEENKFTLRPGAVIHNNEIYLLLSHNTNSSIASILADTRDYKADIKSTTDRTERIEYARMIGLRRLADGVNQELDTVFQELFS